MISIMRLLNKFYRSLRSPALLGEWMTFRVDKEQRIPRPILMLVYLFEIQIHLLSVFANPRE